MPVGRNCCYKESVSTDRKFLSMRFFVEKKAHPAHLNRVHGVDYEILSFTGIVSCYEGIAVSEIIL